MKIKLLLLLCLIASPFVEPRAQQQGLDPSFGDNGIVITDFGNSNNAQIWDMTLQPDNKILATGFGNNGAIALRYLPDGTLDKTFGNNGTFLFQPLYGTSQVMTNIHSQSDGKVLLAGYYRPTYVMQMKKFLLIRLLPDGSLDPDFAAGGVDTNAFYDQCDPSAMAVQQDGKILLGGHYSGKIALARYMPDGGLDSSFGDKGMALIDNGPLGGNVSNIEILPGGRILLGGHGYYLDDTTGRYLNALMLTRLSPDGSLDTTFNNSGQVYHRICNCYNYGYAIKRLSDGKILLAGHSKGGNLLRLNEDGSLDTTFNHTGIATMDSAEIRANIIVGPDNKIWIGGTRNTDFAVYRFLPEGKPDPTFGENGKITTKIQRKDNRIYAMALQEDGKIVAGGYSRDTFTTPFKITLTRYLPDGKTAIPTPERNNDKISIYPNPANTYLLINNNTGETIQAIAIYTVDGRKVKELTLQGKNRIPTRSLAPGVYILHLHIGDKILKEKIAIAN